MKSSKISKQIKLCLRFVLEGYDLCDFGEVEIYNIGVIQYFHNCYYPEFSFMDEWECGSNNFIQDIYDREYKYYTGIYDFYENHPCYGKIVNSLCWKSIYYDVNNFLQDKMTYAKASEINDVIDVYYNKKYKNYAMRKYSTCTSEYIYDYPKPPKNFVDYDFWVKLYIKPKYAQSFEIDCFYPNKSLETGQDIKVVTVENGKSRIVKWKHEDYGLTLHIINTYLKLKKYNLPLNVCY